jgi:hypothetical protein
VRDPRRLVGTFSASPEARRHVRRYLGRWQGEHTNASGIVLMRNEGVELDQQAAGSRVSTDFVTANYLHVCAIDMALGRGVTPKEDRHIIARRRLVSLTRSGCSPSGRIHWTQMRVQITIVRDRRPLFWPYGSQELWGCRHGHQLP